VGSLISGALSWLVVVTIGLAPMLVYWLARVIGRGLRRKAPGPPAGSPLAEAGRGSEGSGTMQLRRGEKRPSVRILPHASRHCADTHPVRCGAGGVSAYRTGC
jgi:hypothetical protein